MKRRTVESYLSLITSEHQGSPKYMAWLAEILQVFQDTSDCIASIPGKFNLVDTDGDSSDGLAYGVQLDIIGEIVGQSRIVDIEYEYTTPSDFIPLGQTPREWSAIAVDSNGDVYASASQYIYKQTGGVGDFILYQDRGAGSNFSGMAADSNGNLYGCQGWGYIYKKTGNGNFVQYWTEMSTFWQGITVAPNGDVYACIWGGNSDIYKQTGGIGNFLPLNQGTYRTFHGMAAAPNGDIYVCQQTYGIYKQTGGVGNFIAITTSGSFYDITVAPNGDVYACTSGGDIYKQTGGVGNFLPLGQTSRDWMAMAAAPNGDVYACDHSGDIYKLSAPISPILNDDDYRTLLLAKIGRNHWDGKIESLQNLWHNIFPTGTIKVKDFHNMSMGVITTGDFTPTIEILIKKGYIIPRPQGVLQYGPDDLPILGWDGNDEWIAGWDAGKYT